MSTIGWSGSGRTAERMSWWLMGFPGNGQTQPPILPDSGLRISRNRRGAKDSPRRHEGHEGKSHQEIPNGTSRSAPPETTTNTCGRLPVATGLRQTGSDDLHVTSPFKRVGSFLRVLRVFVVDLLILILFPIFPA